MNAIVSVIAGLMLTHGAAQPATEVVQPADILANAPDDLWIQPDPENVLVMDLPSGTMYIEMRPDLAPLHVERVTQLTRDGFYNGLIFHRVIDGFMAQGGDPTGTGQGASELPDLMPEFARDLQEITNAHMIGRDDRAAQVGFVGTIPVGTQAPTLPSFLSTDQIALWGLHCEGVLSMARATSPTSANSQFFVMFGDSRDGLDQGYTVWGKVMAGYKNARRINRGEPPVRPTPIVRMRILADLPEEEQVVLDYLDPTSDEFDQYLAASRQVTATKYVRDMCTVDVPVRINGEVTQ